MVELKTQTTKTCWQERKIQGFKLEKDRISLIENWKQPQTISQLDKKEVDQGREGNKINRPICNNIKPSLESKDIKNVITHSNRKHLPYFKSNLKRDKIKEEKRKKERKKRRRWTFGERCLNILRINQHVFLG